MVRVSLSAIALRGMLQAKKTRRAAMLQRQAAKAGRRDPEAKDFLCATFVTLPTRINGVSASRPKQASPVDKLLNSPRLVATTNMANALLIRDGLTLS